MAFSEEEKKNLGQLLSAKRNQELRQKAPEMAKQGKFSRAIDFLMRPNYASAGAAKALVKGENVWDEFWKGMKGEDKETYSDVLDELGWKPTTKTGKIARGVVGFVADVALDPTTYLGIGAVNKLGRAAKAGQVLSKSGKVIKGVDWAAEIAKVGKKKKIGEELLGASSQILKPTLAKQAAAGQRSLLQFGGETLIKGEPVFKGLTKAGEFLEKFPAIQKMGIGANGGGFGLKWIKPAGFTDEAWDTFKKGLAAKRKAQIKGAAAAGVAGKKLIKEVDDAIKKGVTKEQTQQILMKLSDKTVEILPELEPFYKQMTEISNLSTDLVKAVGDKVLKGFDVTHFKTDLGRKLFPGKQVTGSVGLKHNIPKQYSRVWYKTNSGDIINLVEGKVYREGKLINELTQEGIENTIKTGIKVANPLEINKGVGKKIFEEELGVIAAGMINKIGKVQGGMEFAGNIKQLGKMAADAPATWQPTKLKLLKGADGKALRFDPKVVEHLDEIFEKYNNPELMNDFLKGFKKAQNTWKGLVTYANIPFHARNAISNIWQNSLAGISPTNKAYITAGSIKTKLKMGKELVGDEAKYMAEFIDEALAGVGWIGADIEKSLTKKPNFLFGWGQALGETIEDHAKLAHFIAKRKAGFSKAGAAESVQKYLFDYGDVSDFERIWMKTLMPFYTWSRKNLPLQIETLIKTPEKIARLGKVRSAFEQGFDKKDKPPAMILPDWMKEKLPVYMGGDKKISKFGMIGGWLPSADLGNVLEPLKTAMSNVSPFLKGSFELNANYNTFFKNEISEYEGQRDEFLGLHIPKKWAYVVSQIRPLNEIHKVFKLRYDPLTKDYERKMGKGLQEYITAFKIYENDIKYLKQNVSGKGWSPATTYQKIQRDQRRAKKMGEIKGFGQGRYKEEAKRLQELLDTYDRWNDTLGEI